MKKIFLLLAAVCTLSFSVSCSTKKEKEQEGKDPSAATIDSLRQALTQSQNESSDMIETLSQIQDGFDQINEAEGIVNVENRQGERGNKQLRCVDLHFVAVDALYDRGVARNGLGYGAHWA